MAHVQLTGEGFSQFATRHGNLVSAKTRLKVKAVQRGTGTMLAVDRQVTVRNDPESPKTHNMLYVSDAMSTRYRRDTDISGETVSVDPGEQIAGKAAFQESAANLAERLLPELVPLAKE